MAWIDASPGNNEIFFSHSTDGGVSFSLPKNISQTPGNSNPGGSHPMVLGPDGSINIVWDESGEVLFTRSNDGGVTFSPGQNITQDPTGIRFDFVSSLAIGADSSIYIAWNSQSNTSALNGGFFTRSTDGGATFSTITKFPDTPFGALFFGGEISLGPGNDIYIATAPTGPAPHIQEIFFIRSTDGGANFSTPLNLSSNSGISQSPYHFVDQSGNFYVIWHDNTTGNFEIFLRHSADGGLTFSPILSEPPVNVTQNSGQSHGATVVVSDPAKLFVDEVGNLSFVWFDSTLGNFDVFFTRSTDGGATFSAQENVSASAGQKNILNAVAESDGNICIVWDDNKLGNLEIFLSCSQAFRLTVPIDIKPGSFPNSINLGSGGSVPVAIFSTPSFDATTVDPLSITLASAAVRLKGKGTPMASFDDINGDGLLDLVVHVSTEALELSDTDTEAVLEGEKFDGTLIRGMDTIRVVP